MMILSAVINSVLQLALFASIPFLFWVIKHRKEQTFFEYVGMKRPVLNNKWWLFAIILVVYVGVYTFDSSSILSEEVMNEMSQNPNVASTQFAGMGASAIIPVFLMSFIQNGLCEELFFRGFIGKNLIKKCGLPIGVVLQAVIFALIHNIMFAGIVPDITFHILIFVTISIMASVLCLFNEKVFNGSIWISVLIHGLGNFISNMMVAFNV